MKTKIVFTGGAYYLVTDADMPHVKPGSDFTIANGRKWVKSRREFRKNAGPFAVPAGHQVLTEAEAKAQGLMS